MLSWYGKLTGALASNLPAASGCGLDFNAQSPIRMTRASPELENEQPLIDFGVEAGVVQIELQACDDAGTGWDEHSHVDITSHIDDQPTQVCPSDDALVAVSLLFSTAGDLSALDIPPCVIAHPHLDGKTSSCVEDVKPERVGLRKALVIRHMLCRASDGPVADVLQRVRLLPEDVAAACTDLLILFELDCDAMEVYMQVCISSRIFAAPRMCPASSSRGVAMRA